MTNTAALVMLMQMNTLGLTILYKEMRLAKLFYSKRRTVHKGASDSLAFIQGTGLEIMMETFGLNYDADKLRSVFFSMIGDHERVIETENKDATEHGRRARQHTQDNPYADFSGDMSPQGDAD